MAPRINPVDDGNVSPEVRDYFRIAEKRGAPNSTLLRILARDPDSLRTFYDSWNRSFYGGHIDHVLKEIVRVRMAELRGCHYWSTVRSAEVQRNNENDAKIKAAWNLDDPIFTPRERAAMEMASIFTEPYKDFADADLARWKQQFSDEELVELAVFMALADGFGKVVEMLGLGNPDQICKFEIW